MKLPGPIPTSDIRTRIIAAVHHYGSQRTMAKAMGISESYLSDMLLGRREWSDDLLAHVGIERYTAYHDCGKPKWMKTIP